ncbi:MAG: sigma-54 dependent transcriptional regulator [Pseudomonadota bacterium]
MPASSNAVLIVEDDRTLRETLVATAFEAGIDAISAADGEEAMTLIEQSPPSVVISDIQMQPVDGHQLLDRIRERHNDLPVVLMTAYESVQSAVSALRAGANDYLIKPFEAEVLISSIDRWLGEGSSFDDGLLANDTKMRAVAELAKRVAGADATVLLSGESGVGKEVVFRFIHEHSSRRMHTPVAINCAAIPENMLEAVLFGYEKGAFTGAYKASQGKFEQAQDSTILLDEVSEMPLALQAKLLRVLQERQVERLGSNKIIPLDVRVVATTNRDLKTEVEQGRFREDLYYRLNVIPIHIPPLRERSADIIPLAEMFLARGSTEHGGPAQLSAAARERLLDYSWPGNVRELENVMQRAAILGSGLLIEASDFVFENTRLDNALPGGPEVDEDNECLGQDLKDHERRLILNALEDGNGSRKFAAERLGISPRTLRYKIARMKDAGIAVPS